MNLILIWLVFMFKYILILFTNKIDLFVNNILIMSVNYNNLTVVAENLYDEYSAAYENYSVAYDDISAAQIALDVANASFNIIDVNYHHTDQEWIDSSATLDAAHDVYDNADVECTDAVYERNSAWTKVLIARENNIRNVERLIHEENDLQKNILNVMELYDIFQPIIKEKHIVANIINMKYDMEMVNVRKEFEYLTAKYNEDSDDESAFD